MESRSGGLAAADPERMVIDRGANEVVLPWMVRMGGVAGWSGGHIRQRGDSAAELLRPILGFRAIVWSCVVRTSRSQPCGARNLWTWSRLGLIYHSRESLGPIRIAESGLTRGGCVIESQLSGRPSQSPRKWRGGHMKRARRASLRSLSPTMRETCFASAGGVVSVTPFRTAALLKAAEAA